MDNTLLRAKTVVLGDATVGKTSLTQVFHCDSQQGFPKAYSMTTGVDLAVRNIKIPDSPYSVELFIYDCAGQETFQPFISKVLGSSALVMLVYDVTEPSTLSAAVKWLERARQANKDFKMHSVLVGNKTDLDKRRKVTLKEGQEAAANMGLSYFECSAKDSNGVDEPFYYLAGCLHEEYIEKTTEFQDLAEQLPFFNDPDFNW